MRVFRVYVHSTRGSEAVKVGFSWPAFFGWFYWMRSKRLYALAGLFPVAVVALWVIQQTVDAYCPWPEVRGLLILLIAAGYLAAWVVPALKGNAWREANLSRRGYELRAEVRAASPDAAIAQLAGSHEGLRAASPPAKTSK